MFPCDTCQRTDFSTASGLAIHVSSILHNEASISTLAIPPNPIDELLSDEEQVKCTHCESSTNLELPNSCIETGHDHLGNIPNPTIQQDHSSINFQRSPAIVTQVARTE